MNKFVYFAQAFTGGPIKIGISVSPAQRIKALNTGAATPLDLIVAIPGGRAIEEVLHRLFAGGRLHGEWFSEETPGLAEVIEVFLAPDEDDELHREIHEQLAAIGTRSLVAV